MKLIKILALMYLFHIPNALIAQETNKISPVDNMKLSVSELIIKGNDISDSLKIVYIVNGLWMEYNRNDEEIGRAKILKNSNNEIKVKWISATNGAKKGAQTIYMIKRNDKEYTFDIYYDDKKQGYFVAESQ